MPTSPFAQLIVMGVSGSGKTTLGQGLAAYYGFVFLDADDFHTLDAKAKMARGEGLTDADRAPWLARLKAALEQHTAGGEGVVLACSALKASYRTALSGPQTGFIYLDVPQGVLRTRLEERQGSYAKASLLPSQLAALEKPGPDEAVTVHVKADEDAGLVLADALRQLAEKHAR
ncbi:gluconokinase [Deinococcus rubellus]|uniref:Gluconokinase n=1 Tax=Deinococcus rubellus TaxID=1889240 RepID=A0ABY5YFB9_9DEIO|nr:gluconokinase, GntK/IdnK-type [Deinococcus rubellus]UWX63535.1 gluconokinase, GntK/IdnK-type [Deinococcus rubellus]